METAEALFRRVFLGGVLCAVAACGGETPVEPVARAVDLVISGVPTWAHEGREIQLTATWVDSLGRPTRGDAINWTSGSPSVATVTSGGLVTTRRAGRALLRAEWSGGPAGVEFPVVDSLVANRVYRASAPFGLARSGGKAFVTLLDTDSLAVVDIANASLLVPIPLAAPGINLSINAAGTRAFVVHKDPAIHGGVDIIALSTSTLLETVPIPNNPYAVLVSPDGNTVWVTSETSVGDLIYAMDVPTRAVVDSVVGPVSGATHLLHHPTLPRLYVSGATSFAGQPNLYELQATTLDTLRGWTLGGLAQGMVTSPDGAQLYVLNEDGWIDIIDLVSGLPSAHVTLPEYSRSIALSPDGSTIAVSVGNPYNFVDVIGGVWLLNAATMMTRDVILTEGSPYELAYTADGSRLIVANEFGWVDYLR